jgi:hypothetical protein
VWVGLPLGLLLLGTLAWWLLRAWLRIADARQLFLLAALAPFLAHSFFEFPFAYSYFLFPAAWLAGNLGASQAAQRTAPLWRPPRRDLRPALFVLTAAFAALCLAVAVEYLLAEEDHRVMRFELRKVGRRPADHEAPDLVLLTQLRELVEVGRMQPAAGLPSATIERMGNVSARNGWATLDLTYAATLGLNGQPAEASRQLALLRSVYGRESAQQAYALFRAFQGEHPELQQVQVP